MAPPAGDAIRVVLLCRSLEVGGAETQLVALATRLHRVPGFSVAVVTFYPQGSLAARLREAGIEPISLDKRGRYDVLGFLARLRQVLEELRPHVLHSFMGPPNLLAALVARALHPRPRVVWGVRASDMDLAHYDWTWRAVFLAERLLARLADRIVANSFAGKAYVVGAGFPAAKLLVIPNGIDAERFRPAVAAGLRQELLGGGAGPLIGMVARLDPMKDHETLLAAAALVARDLPGARFVCAGGGSDAALEHLRQRAKTLEVAERVRFLGARADVPEILNALDICTLTSAYGEGFPNAIGEAMACGKVCVATDVGDSAALVADTGAIVPRRNPAALAAAWSQMAGVPESKRAALGGRARQRIVQEFSTAAMVEKSANLYRSLAGAS